MNVGSCQACEASGSGECVGGWCGDGNMVERGGTSADIGARGCTLARVGDGDVSVEEWEWLDGVPDRSRAPKRSSSSAIIFAFQLVINGVVSR